MASLEFIKCVACGDDPSAELDQVLFFKNGTFSVKIIQFIEML